jgi:Na+/phosphate symporter
MALKELLSEMYDLISDVVESTDLLYASLINNNLRVIEEADARLQGVGERLVTVTKYLLREKESEGVARLYVSVPSHIQVMGDSMARLSSSLRKKINEDVLFSDRALSELEYMFERVRDMLIHCRDMVLARNTLVARHLEESDKAVVRSANEYATRHEERLIEGLCTPKASSIFIEMLEAFKETASQARNIGKDLAG